MKAFIFDMDGVIVDSEPLHFETDKMVMKDFGIEISDEELISFVGATNPYMWSELLKKYKLSASVEDLLELQHKYKLELFGQRKLYPIEGITELLHNLRERGAYIGLASSSSRQFITMILETLGIYNYFDVIVSGEEVINSKPAPDIFLKAAQTLQAEPEYCIVLEDSGNGVKGAKAAGMKCIAYRNPNSGEQDLSQADCIVDSLLGLEYMLDKLFA